MWNFRLAPVTSPDFGFQQTWQLQELSVTGPVDEMPVPGNYEDIKQKSGNLVAYYNHVGWAWYDRQFFIPRSWKSECRIFLRVGAAHYNAIAYINGYEVVKHEGGSLPFVAETNPDLFNFDDENRISITVDNTLNNFTVPLGQTRPLSHHSNAPKELILGTDYEFKRYGGIHDYVILYTTPRTFIDDIYS